MIILGNGPACKILRFFVVWIIFLFRIRRIVRLRLFIGEVLFISMVSLL